ncbi:NAD(P)H-binding protein [Antribacter sp. KLBMP9083]|uniref:NAD(P)H-binding protein n=1 Tax=Antribacter soli TaxID=2910976 RepID=A0AA41QDH7_9MICO|nr:NAD(P)H-binding protein [Antribacter soli]MCF4121147.1 NAD(P)H-binding protein [Antribacter soli]
MSNGPLRIAVLGAGGRTGRLILDAALRAGHKTLAVVRSPARAGIEPRPGLDITAADARDSASLQRILRPGDVIISAIGPSGRTSNGLYESVGTAIVTATATTGPRRFIGITSSGVRDDDPNHPWWYRTFLVPVMRDTYDDMSRMEAVIEASDLDWTFVRPARLTDDDATGTFRVEDGSNPPGGIAVPRQDVADFAISCTTDDAWSRTRPTISR